MKSKLQISNLQTHADRRSAAASRAIKNMPTPNHYCCVVAETDAGEFQKRFSTVQAIIQESWRDSHADRALSSEERIANS